MFSRSCLIRSYLLRFDVEIDRKWDDLERSAAQGGIEVVTQNDQGEYEFSYYAKRRSVQALLGPVTRGSYVIDRQAVRVSVHEEAQYQIRYQA